MPARRSVAKLLTRHDGAADRGEYREAAGIGARLLKPWPHSRSHFLKITARNFRKNRKFGMSAHHERSRGLESHGLVFNVPCMERGRSRNFLNLARSCRSTKTCARVDLSLNFGLAAKAPNVIAVTDAAIPIWPTQTTCQWERNKLS
jgi:hypothetical protein